MSSNGTPQGYLADITGRYNNQYRDRSMEQNYTNSGNPSGYVPSNRYIPPNFNMATGSWDQNGLTYQVPQAYGQGQAGMPTGPTPMPYFNPMAFQQPLSPQQQAAVGGYGPGMMPVNRGAPATGGGTAQPPSSYVPQWRGNTNVPTTATPGSSTATINTGGNSVNPNDLMSVYGALSGAATGTGATGVAAGYMPQFGGGTPQPASSGGRTNATGNTLPGGTATVGNGQLATGQPVTAQQQGFIPQFYTGGAFMAYPQGNRVRGTERV